MGICHVKIGLPKKWCGDARDKVASYLGNTARHRRSDWASEACPTHWAVQSRFRAIWLSCPIMRRRNYVRACSKSVLGG